MIMSKNTFKIIIYCGLFAVPFVPFLVSSSFFFPFITTKAFAWRIIVEIVFAAWLLLALMSPELRPKKSVILYAFVLFLVVVGLSDIFGAAPVKSFWSNYERMEGFVSLIHLGMFFLVIGSVFDEIDWKRWWNTTLAASFLMVVYSALQLAGSVQINQGGVRVDGTLGNATYLAVYMLFHVFIALLMLWREKKNISLRWVYGILIVLQTWVLYHTATRGAILGLLGGLFIVALLNIRNKKEDKWLHRLSLAVIISLMVVVGGFYLARNSVWVKESLVLSRFANISTKELKSGGRSFVWPMAIDGFKERPLLGWGQDNFNYVFNEHYNPEMYKLEPWFDRAHNIFLDWGVAGGVLGLLSYLSLYVAFLWALWKGKTKLAYEERTILTALLAAYFFHNFFVFDQLISYIFFFALLAYVHQSSLRDEEKSVRSAPSSNPMLVNLGVPTITLLLLAGLYFVNIKPLSANLALISGLQAAGHGNYSIAMEKLQAAYEKSRLGRSEVVEQIAANIQPILANNAPVEKKNEFFLFAKEAMTREAKEFDTDARIQIVAGVFFSKSGLPEEAFKYFNQAQKLIPGKQVVYFEAGNALLVVGREKEALEWFKKAYELTPEYDEAKVIYLAGAIYAGDRALESRLIRDFPRSLVVMDNRIIGAYYTIGRKNDAVAILEERIKLDPANEAIYREYIKQVQN